MTSTTVLEVVFYFKMPIKYLLLSRFRLFCYKFCRSFYWHSWMWCQ